jgi:hypothetical protein
MELSEPSDREVLASANPGHYGVFSDRHFGAVRSYVASGVRQPDVVFWSLKHSRALEKRAQFGRAHGPAAGWLIGIARNLIIDSDRRGQVEADSRVRLGMAAAELDDEQLARITDLGRGRPARRARVDPCRSARGRAAVGGARLSATPRSQGDCAAGWRGCCRRALRWRA